MFHDIKATPISPSKGKAREKTHWQAGWWDFHPLSERPQKYEFCRTFFPYLFVNVRPIEWSQSSVLFTAHPTQPLVCGRYFSSSKQFKLPSPPLIVSSPKSYEPPSIISVAPDDEWLFAYFPGHNGDGAGCLWKRGAQIDSWTVREWWSFAPGGGVVVSSWLGQPRVVREFHPFLSPFCNRFFSSFSGQRIIQASLYACPLVAHAHRYQNPHYFW